MSTSPSSPLLQGKLALVTGASRGIGEAVAQRCAQEGAALVLTARSADKLRQVAERCRAAGAASCDVEACDLSSPRSIDQLAAAVLERHGGVDLLVNNAGSAEGDQDVLTGNPDAWERMLALNTLAPMRFARLFAPAMAGRPGGGLLVNVGSLAGTFASAQTAAYCASKWGVRGWTLACHEALKEHGIRTMVIEPGFVATDLVLAGAGGALIADRVIQSTLPKRRCCPRGSAPPRCLWSWS